MEENSTSNRRKTRITVIISVIAALIIIALSIFVLLQIKKNAESFTDIEIIFSRYSNKKGLIADLSEYASENISPYENIADVNDYLNKTINGAAISVVPSEDKKTYIVSANGTDAAAVVLDENRECSVVDCFLCREYAVEAPKGAEVILNGKKMINPSPAKYRFTSEYELSSLCGSASDRYDAGSLFLQPVLSASLNGEMLDTPAAFGDCVCFKYPSSFGYELTATAPVGTELIVNNIRVTDMSERTIVQYPGISRFEADTEDAISAFSQHLGFFFEQPDIKALYYGEQIFPEEDGITYLVPQSKLGKQYEITAPTGSVVRVNGVPLGESDVIEKNIPLPLFEGTEKYVSAPPTLVKYRIEGLLFEPQITCTATDGSNINLDTDLSDETAYRFHLSPSSAQPDQTVIQYLKAFAKAYVKYNYNGLASLGTNYNKVISYTISSVPARSYLKARYKIVYTAPQIKSITDIGDIVFTDTLSYDDGISSCTAIYNFSAVNGGVRYDYCEHIELIYRNEDRKQIIVACRMTYEESE